MKNLYIRLALLFLFLFEAVVGLYAQRIGIPEVKYYNRQEYGAATQNWRITQDDHGMMFFANNFGVLRFDGTHWDLDKVDPMVRCVKWIGDRMYCGSTHDFGYYEYDASYNLKYRSLASTEHLRSIGDAWEVFELDGKIIFQTTAALVIFKDDKLESVVSNVSRIEASEVVNGLMLVYDDGVGVKVLRGDKLYMIPDGEIFSDKIVSTMISLSDEEIIIGTESDGLFIWDMDQITPWNTKSNDHLKKANIYYGTRYNDDSFILGTIQEGFFLIHNNGDIIMSIDNDKGLGNNTVLGLFVDRDGGVWCGLDNGIAYIDLNSKITYLSSYYNIGTGSAQLLDKGFWYLGTNQALYMVREDQIYDPDLDRDDLIKVKESEGKTWDMFSDNNTILCGHNSGVLSIVGDEARLITPITEMKGGVCFIPIEGSDDTLLCGTYSGLILLKKENEEWHFVKRLSGYDGAVHSWAWDRMGNLWVAHTLGEDCVDKLSISEDLEHVISCKEYQASDLDGDKNLIVVKMQDNTFLLSDGGLFIVDALGEPERYSSFDSFLDPDNMPMVISEDRFRNLWFSNDNYVKVLRSLEDGTYKEIRSPFVSLNTKLMESSHLMSVWNRENVMFPVEDGFAHYRKVEDNFLVNDLNVHLVKFKSQQDSVVHALYQTSSVDRVTVQNIIPEYRYKENSFEIEFSSTSFGISDIEYSSCLSNVDIDFTKWEQKNRREFTGLPEGDYSFVVKARNSYGLESEPLVFEFVVLPPWYRTSYAFIVYIILIVLIGYFIIRDLNRRIEKSKEEEKLKQQERFRIKEMNLNNEAMKAEKELVRLRNEKLRGEMIHKEKELANSTLNIIQKNEFLGYIKEQLRKMKTTPSNISRSIDLLVNKIDKDIDNNNNWSIFETHLEQVHEDFLNRIMAKHKDLTVKEKRLSAYIRMGMSSKEIAVVLNISSRAVDNLRSKLRKKMELEQGDNLTEYINKL